MEDGSRYREEGFVVLRSAFAAGPLRDEVERALAEGVAAPIATAQAQVRYVPMMCTPVSLSLLDQLEPIAERLLQGPVLPVRAKGMLYQGDTRWHRDSEHDLPSVGFAAYLDPLTERTGALRVVPGSHQPGEATRELAIPTQPGDLIVFDEHLLHASSGGGMRLQWRVDYFREPQTTLEEARARAYLAGIFPADWDGGYDVERFPSYGEGWLRSGRRAVERLGRLGVYQLAAAQERFTFSKRSST